MKSILLLIFVVLIFDSTVFAQKNSSESHKVKVSQFYGGLGGGFGYKGGIAGISATFILNNNWGCSISYKNNFFKAETTPDNYYDGISFVPSLPPHEFLHITSLKVLKEFPTVNDKVRIGIEGGPSWINYNSINFIPYSSGYFNSNYEKTHTIKNSIGLSLRAKAEFPFSKYFGIEWAGFANINKLKSFIGIELYLIFGTVRN